MNAQRKENIARAIIANRSTAQLCEMFEATNCTSRENLLEEMMVRGLDHGRTGEEGCRSLRPLDRL